MKFFGLSICLVFSMALFSCREDESAPKNEFVIDGEAYDLVNGYYFDIEASEAEAGRILHGTHYSQSFIITDGTITNELEELVCNDCTFQVFIDASSAGADAFTSDDFNPEDPGSTQLSSTAAESYLFLKAEFSNGNGHFESVAKGTVSIAVNTPTFDFDFDFTCRDESNGSEVDISGRFNGVFEEMNASLLAVDH